MGGIKVFTADLNGIRLGKGMTVEEFNSWIVSTVGGSLSDYYRSVIKSNDGGYIAVGHQQSDSQGVNDALIVKYDANLNLVSQHGLGGTGNDYYYSVVESHDGGYVAVGYQDSQGQGNADALIVKYDSNLTLVSQHGLGGTGNDYYNSIIQSNDGGYVAIGYQYSESQGNGDAFIVKYDSNLDVVVQRSLGGPINDEYEAIIPSYDGGYIVVGSQNSEGQGSYDGLIVKYDSNLNLVSQHGLGGSTTDRFFSVTQSNDGGYVAVGFQSSDAQGGTYDGLIVKYDSNLNLINQYGVSGTDNEYYQSIIKLDSGGYVVVGYQNSQGQGSNDALVVKYDENFNLISQHSLGGSNNDYFYSLTPSHDGGYVAVGYQVSDTQGNVDALITKLPNDLSLLTGSLVNHTGLQWSSLSLVESVPSLTVTTPSLVETTTTLTETTPTLSVTTPALIETRSEKQ